MTGIGDTERLGDQNVVTAVVRVVLDDCGDVRHGELVDAATGTTERFTGWEGMVSAVRRWLGRIRD
ncbi:hypothetical protein [Phytohabitans rumicis]|uniref:Uncharacterized protein n=1 Tax=Phytohabitans rumicis TaxID=1076125 RepID=A0A6V8LDL4_9ACTN|nr:hypothetical protein [Phytohabitans rumicis]GFJ92679.1 hypothetical protein Prum_063210 [Phytohabitans rumicis]